MKREILLELKGQIVTSEDVEYKSHTLSWNRAIRKYPLAIVYCKDEKEIINAIKWSIKHNVEIRIRAGRHNYEGFSTGDNILVIDLSLMKKIEVNNELKEIVVQAGVLNEEIYEELGKQSIPFPGGACPTVGIIGYTLGGGWGYSSRYLGLGCDSLKEIELIDYKGEKLVLNESQNSDLFWACRGAGAGNFGVVTKMKFQLVNTVDKVTLITGNYINLNSKKAVEILHKWQGGFSGIDNRFNGKVSIYSKENTLGVKFVALFYGKEDEARATIKDALDISSLEIFIEELSFLEALRKIQYSHPEHEKYKSGGRFLNNNLNEDILNGLINIINEENNISTYRAITFYGMGGQISKIDKSSTAFYYRNAKFILGIQSVWEDDKHEELNKQWVINKFNYLKSLTEGSFISFPLLEQENYIYEYFGGNVKRLQNIKNKYDNKGIFTYEQSL